MGSIPIGHPFKVRPVKGSDFGICFLSMQEVAKKKSILKQMGIGIVAILGGFIALSILVILFFAIFTRLITKPIEIVNDTSQGYKISLFGNGDISDSGYFLDKPFNLSQNERRVFRQRIDCVMIEDPGSNTKSSFDVSRISSEGKTDYLYLSKIISGSPRCWDLEKLEVGKLYHCNKERCY